MGGRNALSQFMSRSLLFLAFTLALALALAGTGTGQLTRRERTAARNLHEAKCAKCHQAYEPKDYSEEEWRLWMTRMSLKANLTPAEEKLLNRYLDAYRAEMKPARP
jgi:hypothetical protein